MDDSFLRGVTHSLAVIHLVLCGTCGIGLPVLILFVSSQDIFDSAPGSHDPNNFVSNHPAPAWLPPLLIVTGYILLTINACAAVLLFKASLKGVDSQIAVRYASIWRYISMGFVAGLGIWILKFGRFAPLTILILIPIYLCQFMVVGEYIERNVIQMEVNSHLPSNVTNNEEQELCPRCLSCFRV